MVGSVYVGDLLPTVTENDLYGIFQAAGQVASVRVCRDHATRRSLGYAYVNYQSAEDGEKAIELLNCSLISNRPCRVMPIKRDSIIRKGQAGNVFIRGLAKSIDSKALLDTFSLFGKVSSCKVKTNRKGESMGFGYIQYAQESDAETAISKANGMLLNGEIIELTKFKLRQHRLVTKDTDTEKEQLPITIPFLKKTTFDQNSPLVLDGVCLYIKNIDGEVTSSQLQDLFTPVVGLCVAHVKIDKVSGSSKEVANVYVKDQETANKAISLLNGSMKFGKPLYVSLAQHKEERRAQLDKTFPRTRVPPPISASFANNNPTSSSAPSPAASVPSSSSSSSAVYSNSAPLLQSRPALATYMPYSPQLASYLPLDQAYSNALLPGFSSPTLAGMQLPALPSTYSLGSNSPAMYPATMSPSLGPSVFQQGSPLTYRVLHPSAMRGRGRGNRSMGMMPHSVAGMGPFQASAAGSGDYWKLSPLVMNLYPTCFSFITNRLLAKEHTNVVELLNDPDVLKVKADEAFKEMQASPTWKTELWNCLYPLVCALRPIDHMSVLAELLKADVAEGVLLLTDSEKLKARVAELSDSLQKRREAGVDWSDHQSIAMALYPRILVTEGVRATSILQLMLQDKESLKESMQSDETFNAKIASASETLKKEAESLPQSQQPLTPTCMYPMSYPIGMQLPGSPIYSYPLSSPLLMPLPAAASYPYLSPVLTPSLATPVLAAIPDPLASINWSDKQSVGEALYPRVEALVPAQAGKITGMLLELENEELRVILLNSDALTEKIKEALNVLMEHLPGIADIDWLKPDSIKRALLPRVQALELLKGEQITKSLLEKDHEDLRKLLENEEALKEQVSKLNNGQKITTVVEATRNKVDWNNKNSIGELLFRRVEMIDRKSAGKLTGMMLEMDNNELRKLLENDDEGFKNKLEEARKVLKEYRISEVV